MWSIPWLVAGPLKIAELKSSPALFLLSSRQKSKHSPSQSFPSPSRPRQSLLFLLNLLFGKAKLPILACRQDHDHHSLADGENPQVSCHSVIRGTILLATATPSAAPDGPRRPSFEVNCLSIVCLGKLTVPVTSRRLVAVESPAAALHRPRSHPIQRPSPGAAQDRLLDDVLPA